MKKIIKRLCEKICNKDELQKECEKLQKQLDERNLILKRIKIVATSNHYGYSKEDMEYREKNCINVKLRKVFELASEFDKDDKIDFWDELNDKEDDE